MEQQILASKRSQGGDVELTLVTSALDFSPRTAKRAGPTSPGLENPSAATRPGTRAGVSPAYLFCKRLIDIVVSLAVLLVGFIPLFVIALCIRLESPGSAIYKRRVLAWQDWDGSMGEEALQTFDAYKLRTMIPDAEAYLQRNPQLLSAYEKDWKLQDDPRITRFGTWLRAASIDEFPQLLNVLKGQMTLVGPRMITAPELARYGEHASQLLSVKPGLTGLWQVSGRQELSYEERVRLDISYVDSCSLSLDIQILLKTVKCVLQRRGAY